MRRYAYLLLIALAQVGWVLACYGLRSGQKPPSFVRSDLIVFCLPLPFAFGLFGVTFYQLHFAGLSRADRVSYSAALSFVCTVLAFFAAVVLGLNIYGS